MHYPTNDYSFIGYIMRKIIASAAIMTLIISNFTYADLLVPSNDLCVESSFTITDITAVAPAGTNIVGAPLDATSCLGFITSPDNDFANDPSPNMGGLGDGLLNGEVGGQGQDNNYYVAGDHFLTNIADSMVNLDNIGVADDPGWIRLGGANTENTEDYVEDGVTFVDGQYTFQYDSIGSYDLGSVINMSFRVDGTWTLAVDPSAIALATLALGRPSIFDHLAFVMKGPNNVEGSWAIYDFNFHDLIQYKSLPISLGDTAYNFTGTWDPNLFVNDNALSHMSVWAHDPPANTLVVIPEPTSLTILALGLIGLSLCKPRKNEYI